jgi:hypothetical protein
MQSLRDLVEQTRASVQADKSRLAAAAAGTTSDRNPRGLRFPDGAPVIDVATGAAAVVIDGSRVAGSAEEVFRVRYADGRTGARAAHELEPAPAAAPAPR